MSIFSLFGNKPTPKKSTYTLYIQSIGQEVTVTRSARRTIAIALSPDGKRIKVAAPLRIEERELIELIESKSEWIRKKQRSLQESKDAHIIRRYENGAIHLLLGKPYRLTIIERKRKAVILTETEMILHTQHGGLAEKNLKEWYADQARRLMPSIMAPIVLGFSQRHGVAPKSIDYRYATSYWGVCTSKGDIRLNINLVRAPQEAIEYIIAHELCHLIHHNHSKKFYDLLTAEMPDWKERKRRLDNLITCRDGK